MCVSIFSTLFIWNIFHFKKNWTRYYHQRTLVLTQSARYSCQILMKPEFSRHFFFEKYSNTKFHENPSSGNRAVPCGRADGRIDGQTEITKITIAFHNFANAPTKRITALFWVITQLVVVFFFSWLQKVSSVDYTIITNLMHWLLFIRKILLSSTCFEHQVLIFRRT